MADVRTIIGIKNSKTKDGNPAVTYFYTEAFSDYDLKNGRCDGLKVGSEYTQNVFLSDLKVGDKVKMYKDVVNGKNGAFAILTDIVKVDSGNSKK